MSKNRRASEPIQGGQLHEGFRQILGMPQLMKMTIFPSSVTAKHYRMDYPQLMLAIARIFGRRIAATRPAIPG